MEFAETRKYLLKTFIGFLIITALLAVGAVLSGSYGAVVGKVLLTSCTITAGSISSMACIYFSEIKKNIRLGLAGSVLSVIAALLIVGGVWIEFGDSNYWSVTWVFVVIAGCFTHSLLLLMPHLSKSNHWIQIAAVTSIAVLCLLIICAITQVVADTNGLFRLIGAICVVVVLLTLTIPIVAKIDKGKENMDGVLVLRRMTETVYVTPSGVQYSVKKIDAE